MLTALHLCNFKSWSDSGPMHLAPITCLFGTNSSGKTSILQLLLLLKQTTESTDRAQVLQFGGDRTLVDLGTFHDVVHDHRSPGAIEWSFSWSVHEPLRIVDPEHPGTPLFTSDELTFAARVREIGAVPPARYVVDTFLYTFGDTINAPCFGMRRKTESSDQYDLTATHYEYKRFRGRPSPLPAPVKCYGFPDKVYASNQNAGFLADLQLAFEDLFTHVYYLGPLREYPQRQYIWGGAQATDMGQRGERVVEALLASRDRGLRVSRGKHKRRRPLEWVVAYWLQQLGLIHSFSVAPVVPGSNLYQVWVKQSPRAAEVLITDVGFGVSQILPVITLCYYVPEGSIVLLEQPEIHLHPSVQAGLADVLIDAMKTRGIQIILESHSEHLLHRLQRRIAEGKLTAQDVSLYFCEARAGSSRLTKLDFDPYGNIRNWPRDFFGDVMGDLVAMTEAAVDRQLAATGT